MLTAEALLAQKDSGRPPQPANNSSADASPKFFAGKGYAGRKSDRTGRFTMFRPTPDRQKTDPAG